MAEALKLLGLVYRAKKMVLGEDILNNLQKVKLIFIASDISDKSRERIEKKCAFYNIDYIDRFTALELSSALGKNNVKTIGIIDEGFKKALIEKL